MDAYGIRVVCGLFFFFGRFVALKLFGHARRALCGNRDKRNLISVDGTDKFIKAKRAVVLLSAIVLAPSGVAAADRALRRFDAAPDAALLFDAALDFGDELPARCLNAIAV